MALAYSSNKITNEKYSPAAAPHSAGEVHTIEAVVAIGDPLVDNDLVGLMPLPGNCIPVDFKMTCEELSDGTDIIFDVAILNEAGTDIVPNSDLVSASVMAQNNGGQQIMNSLECVFAPATWLAEATCPDVEVAKTIVAKVTTPATTEKTGSFYCSLQYRAVENGV